MPLLAITPNIQESKTARKRTHEEFAGEPSGLENMGEPKSIELSTPSIQCPPSPSPVAMATIDTPGSSPVASTEARSSPAKEPSPSETPSTSPPAPHDAMPQPTQANSTLAPKPEAQDAQGAKRKPSSDKKESLSANKRQKKEAKEAERLEKEEAKAKREAEMAEKRRKREAEAAEKAKKKAAEEAIRAAKAAEKEAKAAEKEAIKRKKEEAQGRQQNLLASFFQKAPGTPSKKGIEQTTKTNGTTIPKDEPQPEKSAYDRAFQPFFIKPDVTLAPQPFEMDDQTKDAKSEILDQYIRGERHEFNPRPFNLVETFNLPFSQKRGIIRSSVKEIMESLHGEAFEQAPDSKGTRTELQTKKLAEDAQKRLNSIPMKYLSFYEDVRPPYFGTVTTKIEAKKLRSLARRPVGKALPLNYDYDSEAEWVEDDGEDLGDDDDDDESHDGDEEMEDFLDDSEDLPAAIRPTFLGEKEPYSTGICFEDEARHGPCPSMYNYQLEFILDTLEHHSGIDPFSTAYWPAPPKKVATKNPPTSVPAPSASMPPPAAPTDAFSALVSSAAGSLPATEAQNLVSKDVFDEFRRAIISEELREFTKGTIVEMLAKKFSSCTKVQVKQTLDRVAHRVGVPGAKKGVKQWALLPAYAL